MNSETTKFELLKVPQRYIKRLEAENTPKSRYRSEFMRDRDRIMYSRAFRRLSGKTQVFLSGYKDHARTRLTHTLEVAQIARTVTVNLGLDENLAEAISLGHDLGHAPFGHIGERVLNIIMNGCESFSRNILRDCDKGFKHNLQSVRIAMDLEVILNLTRQTLFGFQNHTSAEWSSCDYKKDGACCFYLYRDRDRCEKNLETTFYEKYDDLLKVKKDCHAWSFEAFIVDKSDEIAQRHHDMEDALDSKIMSIPESIGVIKDIFEGYLGSMSECSLTNYRDILRFGDAKFQDDTYMFIKAISRFIVNFLVENLIESCRINLNSFMQHHKIKSTSNFEELYPELSICAVEKLISFDPNNKRPALGNIADKLKGYLTQKILNSHPVQRMDGKGRFIIRRLFKAYLTNPQQLPDKTIMTLMKKVTNGDFVGDRDETILVGELRNELLDYTNTLKGKRSLLRVVADYIGGMTDAYALSEYKELYG